MLSPLTIETVPAQPAAVIRLTISRDEIQETMCPAISELMEAVTSQGIGPVGPLYSYHFRIFPEGFDFEAGVPVSSSVQPVGRVQAGELPAATAIRTVYTGPFEGLEAAWKAFKGLVDEAGHSLTGTVWEAYLTDPNQEPDSSKYQTQLNCTLA
ncbi:MAG: GyrI-like domain-containing protein [Verrucomicrobiae bacterium]|nr:GyrI-like domain-containing protein [Verrucomicrobiae bacterium]